MTTESFLHFVFSNNAMLIETLVAAILLTAAFLTFRAFKMAKETDPGGSLSGHTSELEGMLKKVLEKGISAPPAVDEASGAELAVLAEQNSKLKNELNKRLLELEQLRAKADNPAPGESAIPSDVKAALETQIKELQKKLDEFDIISQDIADLSFYKEENQRLQSELDAAKKGGPAAPAASSPAAPVPPATPKPAPAVPETPAAAPAPAPVAAATESVLTPVPDTVPETVAPVSAAAPAPERAVPVNEPPTAVQEVGDEDLIKEYAAMVDAHRNTILPSAPAVEAASKSQAAVADSATAVASEVDLGTLDLDKMVAEAGDLDPSAVPAVAVDEVLNQSIDPDKIAAEATSMAVNPQDKAVMGQFEKFAAKENKK